MRGWRWLVWTSAVGSLAVGCSGGPPPPGAVSKAALGGQPAAAQPAATTAAQKPALPSVKPRMPEPGPPLAPLTYEAKGRRDPFTPVELQKNKPGLDLSTFKLVGVISGRQLLALVEVAGGPGYILKAGDSLGAGHVTDITADSVTFVANGQAPRRETSVTLRLAGN